METEPFLNSECERGNFMEKKEQNGAGDLKVRWYGYLVLFLAILFFSGVFTAAEGPLRALDFTNLAGNFGKLGTLEEGAGSLASNFRGTGGVGAKDSWMFAMTLFPTVMFALGMVKVIEYLDGLKAAQKLLTPLLRPLMGLPGISGLTLIASLQSADAGASMLNTLAQENELTEKEKNIFAAFQFSGGGTLTNYLSSCAALFVFMTVPILIPLVIVIVFKIFGANLMRLYLNRICKEGK
jgi:nucleoside recognition membrane protein YjiH